METKRQTFLDYQFGLLQEYLNRKKEEREEARKQRQREYYLRCKNDPVKYQKLLANAKRYYYKKQIELLEANESLDELTKENEELKKLIENLSTEISLPCKE